MAKENPLLPNRYLRELYAAMMKFQMIEEAVASPKSRRRAARGQEVALATVLLALEAGDLLAEARPTAGTRYLLGARLKEALQQGTSGEKALSVTGSDTKAKLLARVEEGEGRVQAAMGAAMALQTQGGGRFATVLVEPDEIAGSAWRGLLHLVGETEAPLLVVLLPGNSRETTRGAGRLSARSIRWGVPGIPVDASDAIAISRVVQESTGRLRANGGPVLMECLRMPSATKKSGDAVAAFRKALIERGVITASWAERTEMSFRVQMAGRGAR